MKENICSVCGTPVDKSDSAIELGVETGELSGDKPNRFVMHDKHIRCSPSRAQRIVHPRFPPVIDERPAFDIRLWKDAEKREFFIKLYTEAWVRVQRKHNPYGFHESPHQNEAAISCS